MASSPYEPLTRPGTFTPQNSSDNLFDYVTYESAGLSSSPPETDWDSGDAISKPPLYPATTLPSYMPPYSSPKGSLSTSPTTSRAKKTVNPNLYKTELCRSFEATGYCRYGERCQFAHGVEELRPIVRHPKYKTQLCKTYVALGTCPYGSRCRFIHALTKREFEDEQKRAEEEKRRERERIDRLRAQQEKIRKEQERILIEQEKLHDEFSTLSIDGHEEIKRTMPIAISISRPYEEDDSPLNSPEESESIIPEPMKARSASPIRPPSEHEDVRAVSLPDSAPKPLEKQVISSTGQLFQTRLPFFRDLTIDPSKLAAAFAFQRNV
eukprot:TRINITY_DN133031_c0_g1_i1.p1 TRINITY_DN133031_c0_g1~~TRINITY_DN133031_c0_g1_i1.p1  ORF type:complete len:324 (-),score=-28.07 TRINITY_DN133031_c0_g1_i1:104-1075(-)